MGIVVKVTLYQNDRCSLIARAGRQIAQRTDQVGQLSGCRTLRRHVSDKVCVLGADALGDSRLQLIAVAMLVVVIRKVFQLQFIRCSDQAVRMCGRYDRVCKLPDLSLGVLEGTVAVYHDLNMLASSGKDLCLNILHQRLRVMREELDGILGRFIGAEQPEKATPWWVLVLVGLGAAGLGVGAAVILIKKK